MLWIYTTINQYATFVFQTRLRSQLEKLVINQQAENFQSSFLFIYLFIYLVIYLFICLFQDLESEPKTISFSKNGEDLGEAYELTDGLEDKALYPHVLIKNAEFSVNFGSQVKVVIF